MSYRFDDFQACLKQGFSLVDGDYREELTLVQVDRFGENNGVDGSEAFAIVFQSNNPEAIPQQTYQLSNEQLGELQLFIVPIGQDESGVRYEAVFS